MSALVGAGTKDLDNKFTGIIMGDIGRKLDDDQISYYESGLFGYSKGNQAFGFRTDGTAFIGQASGARIEINGQNGFIESSNYRTTNGTEGMRIDLKEGHIDAYNFKLSSAHIWMNAFPQSTNSAPNKDNCYMLIQGEDLSPIFTIGNEYVSEDKRYSIGGITITNYGLKAMGSTIALVNSFRATMVYNPNTISLGHNLVISNFKQTTVNGHSVWINEIYDISKSEYDNETLYISKYDNSTEWYLFDQDTLNNILSLDMGASGNFITIDSSKVYKKSEIVISSYETRPYYLVINRPYTLETPIQITTKKTGFIIRDTGEIECFNANIQGKINASNITANLLTTEKVVVEDNDWNIELTVIENRPCIYVTKDNDTGGIYTKTLYLDT